MRGLAPLPVFKTEGIPSVMAMSKRFCCQFLGGAPILAVAVGAVFCLAGADDDFVGAAIAHFGQQSHWHEPYGDKVCQFFVEQGGDQVRTPCFVERGLSNLKMNGVAAFFGVALVKGYGAALQLDGDGFAGRLVEEKHVQPIIISKGLKW